MSSRHVRSILCALLVLLGIAVLLGWARDIEPLKSVVPGLSTMKINTAICLLLVGLGAAGAGLPRPALRQCAAVSGALVLLIGTLTSVEYAAAIDLGIDQLFAADTGTLSGSGHPGRMSLLTATAWLALGPAIMLLALARVRRMIVIAHVLAGYAAFVAFLAAAGYAFGAEAFWGFGFYTAMAIHTATGLMIAAAILLMTRAEEGWLAPFKDSPDARILLAQLLPISVLLPLTLGFLLLFGSGVGAYNAAFGFAMFVPSTALGLVAVALRVAHRARNAELALRSSEAALRESESRLSSALAISQMGTFEIRVQDDRVVLDSRSREIFGFADGEGNTVEDLFDRIHPEDRQRVLAEVRSSKDEMARMETEYRLLLPDGSLRAIASFSDVEGGTTAERVFGVISDISDRKRLESDLRTLNETLEERVLERSEELERVHEQLRQSQKLEAMGQLTGGVAHDFNNLLSPIIGSLDLIQRRGMDGERTQRLIDGALTAAERAKVLVQRLLAFARRQPLQPAPVDIGALLRGMSELVASTSGPRIKLSIEVEDGLPPATADSNQLEMAILNLAVNARDAMPEGGRLTITAKVDHIEQDPDTKLLPGRYVSLAVADSGVGMDEETLKRSVEPFFSTKGVGRGTGLGLSMVHGLAAQLGGGLELRSKTGLGTVVQLWLPVSEAREEIIPRSNSAEVLTGSGTALLVDDEEMVRISTADMLGELGYVVVESESAEDAVHQIKQGLSPDIVVTDHLMPGMSGADLARWLRADRPTLPVLIISGYADVDDLAPDLPRLAKPFRQVGLAEAIAGLVESAPARPKRRPG